MIGKSQSILIFHISKNSIFFVFTIYSDAYFEYEKCYRKRYWKEMTVKDIRKCIFENYCKGIDFTKKIAIIHWKKQEIKYLVLNATNATKKLFEPAKAK